MQHFSRWRGKGRKGTGNNENVELYVGLSRGVSRSTTRILAKPKDELDPTGKSTKNIVYKDVLN